MELPVWLNITIQFLQIGLFAMAILATAWLVMRQLERLKLRELSFRKRQDKEKEVLMLRLKALERMVIFLERIVPSALLMRVNQGGMTSGRLHFEMLKAIREEFEINLNMQLYFSSERWASIAAARDECVGILHQCTLHSPADRSGADLGRAILETESVLGTPKIRAALSGLRVDAEELLMV